MRVIELLPKVKANNKTFKYIDSRDKELFKRTYDYLRPVDMDFLIKYKAIQFISTNIKH